MATTQEQLDEVNAAITKILTGAQEVRTLNSQVRRANLNDLLGERARLEAKLASENGYDVLVAVFDRRG